MKYSFLFGAWMLAAFSSCRFVEGQRINGDGNVQKVNRSVSGFTGVEIRGSIDIDVAPGDFKVTVESDENIIPYIETVVENDHLVVRFKEGYSNYHVTFAKVYVTAPALNVFDVHGSGNINGNGTISSNGEMKVLVAGSGNIDLDLHSPAINSETYGSGNITLGGETKDFSVSINGSGDVHAFELKSENVKTSIHGSGSMDVFASVKLDAGISGSGDVNYKGSPQISSDIHGSGSVNQQN